jgi:hypothetical protein
MARNFARGAPPPPGSIEWIAVGDMWDPEVAARKMGKTVAGAAARAVSFTDVDAAQNYVDAVDRSVKQARRVHGDKILSRDDERKWDDFAGRWRAFAADVPTIPGGWDLASPSLKRDFDRLLSQAHALHDEFAAKGMSNVPVPYAGELLELLRSMPKKMTAAQMRGKLLAGVKCGHKMLDKNTTWWDWVASRDHLPLERAVDQAANAADIYGRSRDSKTIYSPGDPVYDEFLRRLTLIWIEAAGLYGIREAKASARARLKDDLSDVPKAAGTSILGLLVMAGVAYLGVKWIASAAARPVVVGVPDAYREG